MESAVGAFLDAVVAPLFEGSGLAPVIVGLGVFVVGWAVFMAVIGRRD